jgi:hypothetical protein
MDTELLESSVVRPKQARYQAALRPDMKCSPDSKALSNFSATPIRRFSHCKVAVLLVQSWNCSSTIDGLGPGAN